ncbi:MAG TPA: terminase, partial [Spirochaetia bacterium]|nr:terminase [Spirochaetia bacterium]
MTEKDCECAADPEEWVWCLEKRGREELERLGKILDYRPARLRGKTVAMALAERLLLVRTREGLPAPLRANAAQRAFERRRGERNIVLKARQMGMTTWAAARFFLKTITQPGTLTLEVVHTQEAAEEIFRIVRRFLGWLPEELREGPLRTSRANSRQIVFPKIDSQFKVISAGERNAGRGLTVQNLHCSELARWPGDPAETLAGLRAAMAPGAELILESTPEGVGGCFYEEWQKACETGMVRHFLPWWMEKRYKAAAVDESSLTREEQELRAQHKLSLEQIGYRRQIRA